MNIVKIEDNGWLLEVDLDGGRIHKLGQNDQLILGTFERIDGKKGNTHVCIPNFANEGVEKYGFVFHGPFRNAVWKVANKGEGDLEIECEIDGLRVKQKFSLENEFEQRIEVVNNSDERKRVNVAIHNYWDTEFGWEGIRLNGADITEGIKINPETELKEENLVEIPGKKPIIWRLENLKLAKLWTGFREEDGVKIYDQKYVCLEPEMEFEGFVETEESWLESGKRIVLKQKIWLK